MERLSRDIDIYISGLSLQQACDEANISSAHEVYLT
jgi:hypothetical protein